MDHLKKRRAGPSEDQKAYARALYRGGLSELSNDSQKPLPIADLRGWTSRVKRNCLRGRWGCTSCFTDALYAAYYKIIRAGG